MDDIERQMRTQIYRILAEQQAVNDRLRNLTAKDDHEKQIIEAAIQISKIVTTSYLEFVDHHYDMLELHRDRFQHLSEKMDWLSKRWDKIAKNQDELREMMKQN